MVSMLSRTKIRTVVGCLVVYYRLADASAQCFFPNGTAALDWFQPCNVVAGDESMCCRINETPRSKCLSNGLCLGSDQITIFRESCTDPFWRSPLCLRGLCYDQTVREDDDLLLVLVPL